MPAENVEVAAEVFNIDPPETETPFDEDNPAVEMPPVKVEVPAPVTVKLTVWTREVATSVWTVVVPAIKAPP